MFWFSVAIIALVVHYSSSPSSPATNSAQPTKDPLSSAVIDAELATVQAEVEVLLNE